MNLAAAAKEEAAARHDRSTIAPGTTEVQTASRTRDRPRRPPTRWRWRRPAPGGPGSIDRVTSHGHRGQLAAVVLLVLAWGSTFAAVKVGLDSAPPVLFGGLRSVLGGAVMVALAFARSGRPSLRDSWLPYALLTLLNVVLFFTLQTLAILELPSGLAAVLIYLQPVLTGVLAAPLLGESLTARKIAGLLLGFAGIVVVSAGAFRGRARLLGVGTSNTVPEPVHAAALRIAFRAAASGSPAGRSAPTVE